MTGMMRVKVVKRHGSYAPGDVVWYHVSMATPLMRAGLVEALVEPAVTRQPDIEAAVAPSAPEMAVTRTRARRWRKAG